MSKNIFIWVAHPQPESLCSSIADAYEIGAGNSGANIRRQNLHAMHFDQAVDGGTKPTPPLEPDLIQWQENIAWADHLLVVHPYWWGAMPAKAKAVLDRALSSGFGYKYHHKGMGWDKLLSGRTADAIITADTPPLIDTLIYRKPGRRVIKNQVLEFCGIKTRNVQLFGSVKLANQRKIAGWLRKSQTLGSKAAA